MTEMLATVLAEGAKAWGSAQSETARYAYLSTLSGKSPSTPPEVKEVEITLPGVDLNNYSTRTELEDGEHVLIAEHKERLEKKFVPTPPPTSEEIASLREHKIALAKIWGSVASVGILVAGAIVIFDRRKQSVYSEAIVQDNRRRFGLDDG